MELKEIEQHWKNWAKEFKQDVRATTKTPTIKALEVAAFHQAFKQTPFAEKTGYQVLEVGCGNGHNCFALSDLMPKVNFTGVDLIPEMIDNANKIKQSHAKYAGMNFLVGNVLSLDSNSDLKNQYDVVFTDRCLINLNTHELQTKALDQLCRKTAQGGYIFLIENVQETYGNQNRLRELTGLQPRTPDKFNLFLNEAAFLAHAKKNLTLVNTRDFASLHDLLLYVLVPALNNGKVDYDSPIVLSATKLLLSASAEFPNAFGSFGQNRLYIFKKEGPIGS